MRTQSIPDHSDWRTSERQRPRAGSWTSCSPKATYLAVKGYGGFHIAASTILEEPLLRLRDSKHRREKPFAIMAKDLDAAKSFGEVDAKEQELLTSPQRPIVLLNKKSNYNLSPLGGSAPAQRRRHAALHGLALHALRRSRGYIVCYDQRQPTQPTHSQGQRCCPENPRRNSRLFPVPQPQNRPSMRRLSHARPRRPPGVPSQKPRLRTSPNPTKTESQTLRCRFRRRIKQHLNSAA